jgi:hypothetical protein
MLNNINYQIWFKVCKPIKRKYQLSTNAAMVLNGSYVLYKALHKGFTLRSLRMFVTYFNSNKINAYIKLLISKGYIIQSGQYYNTDLYSISAIGLQVIEELNESYQIELSKFCNKYDIVL